MSAFDLPFADAVLKPHDIVSTCATALTTILLDYRHMYHDIVCIINEAEEFYEVSHDIIIIMAKFDDSCKGNAVNEMSHPLPSSGVRLVRKKCVVFSS
jgi:hypothetical protein